MRRSAERRLKAAWVSELFARLEHADHQDFFGHVADDVHWTVMGSHPLAGDYDSKQSLIENTFERIERLLTDSLRMKVDHVLVTDDTAVVELTARGVARNGKPFHNRCCWVARFESDMIVEVRSYLDSELVVQLIRENEPSTPSPGTSSSGSSPQIGD